MQSRYKVVISSKNLYKEVDLAHNIDEIKVGTGLDCAVRLRKELFFESIEITFIRREDTWSVICSDNIYFTVGDLRKLITKQLAHGDELTFKYQNSNSVIFNVSFALDFDYEKKPYNLAIDLKDVKRLCVGGASQGQIVLKSPYVGTDGFVIERENSSFYLRKINSKYGVYLNGKRNEADVLLQENDFISLANFSFCFLKGRLYTSKNANMEIRGMKVYEIYESRSEHVYPKFNRSTRMQTMFATDTVQVKDPSPPPGKPRGNIVMQLFPAIAMLVVTVGLRGMLTSSGTGSYILISACTMSIGIIATVASIVHDRRQYKKDMEKRVARYNQYIEKKEAEIQKIRVEEAEAFEDVYYSLEAEVKMVDDFSAKLFDRSVNDKDYLEIRIGTGINEALRKIEFKKQEKYDCEDDLADIPGDIAEKYKYIENAPIILNLKEKNAIGVLGARENLYKFLKNITLDLATRQYYADTKLYYIIDETRKVQFEWLRLLPHLYNEVIRIRNIVCDTDSKNVLFEYLYKELSQREVNRTKHPNIIVFVYDDVGIKRHPISQFIGRASDLGVTFIFFEEKMDFIPDGCTDIITLHSQTTGQVVSASDKSQTKEFVFPAVPDSVMTRMVNKLAPVYCEEVSLEGTLTKNITLFELLHIMTVDDIDLKDNWAKSKVYESMAAPLGVRTKNEVVCLDLNEKHHGPHGLVAGTTGSGKSEILQSYILSMALLFHPYEVGFVIIDFKGGGMVNQFKELPHLIGAITNIDGNEINRSLKSIKAELQKRQRLFAEVDVNHIDKYIKKYKAGETKIPLPHLIIIVDEFAELKADQPEFMKELISAARIGRSLGVHLILATQKPSGVVDAQIWSNSKFKLCLKVQSKEDSNEVIKTPLAAEIKEPGRAYLQVGNNEIFELFQSAYSGASAVADANEADKEFVMNSLNFSGLRTVVYQKKKQEKKYSHNVSQLEAIVDHVNQFCRKEQIVKLPNICLPPLPTILSYSVQKVEWQENIYACIGLYDDPDNQVQKNYFMNLTANNYMLIGSAQTGKTNILQTIIRSLADNYSPKEVNLYIVDFGSMILKNFVELKHVGGVVCSYEDEKVKSLFRLLNEEIITRKTKLAEVGVSSFAAYKEAGKTDLPQIVVLIDNMTALKELYLQEDDMLLPLCRDGLAVGVSFVIANLQTAGIGYRYLNNFEGRIALFCNETSEYSMMFEGNRTKLSNTQGRTLVQIEKNIYECQTYLSFEGEKEYERVQAIKKYVSGQNEKYADIRAKLIPEMPNILTSEYIYINYPDANVGNNLALGLDFATIQPVQFDIWTNKLLVLSGKKDSMKDIFAKYIVNELKNRSGNSELYILDDLSAKWSEYEFLPETVFYSTASEMVIGVISEIGQKVTKRYEDLSNRVTDSLENEPWLILLIESADAIAEISKNKAIMSIARDIIEKYSEMKVFVLFTNISNTNISFSAPELMKIIKENKKYIIFDEIGSIKLTDIPVSLTRKYAKTLDKNDAYLIDETEIKKIKVIS